jgi:hypothetical protein
MLVRGVVVLVAALAAAVLLTAVAAAATAPRFSAPVLVKSDYAWDRTEDVPVAVELRDGDP